MRTIESTVIGCKDRAAEEKLAKLAAEHDERKFDEWAGEQTATVHASR
jgi:hypothetical protein